MMHQGKKVYKIGVNIPAEFLDILMDSVNDVMIPLYPKYDRTFMYWPVRGTWRPLEGADPYDGEIGEVSTADEMRIEFAVTEEFLSDVIRTIIDVHPYEEPAIDVIPMIGWKDVIASDGT